MPTYLGPSSELTLADGTVVHPGEECTLDDATRRALENAGNRFSDTVSAPAPQSASENLAQQGTTAELQAQASGLSAGSQTATPAPAPAPPPVPVPTPPTPPATPPATPKPPAS